MKKDKITLKDFKALVAKEGYTCRTKRVGFEGFGYGSKRFLSLWKGGKKIEFGCGTKERLEAFRKEHPHLQEWKQDIKIVDGDETLILEA